MKQPPNTPCKDCPFRKNAAPGWLGTWSGPEEVHRYVMAEGLFPCHLTMLDKSERRRRPEQMSLCKGAILYMHKNAKLPHRNAEINRAYSEAKGEDTSNILNGNEFFQHHTI